MTPRSPQTSTSTTMLAQSVSSSTARADTTLTAALKAMSSRPRVVAVIPRGEVMRNFVYTGAFDVVGQEADLSLISVKPNETIWRQLEERFGGPSRLRELHEIPERWFAGVLRESLDIAHGRWLWSAAAQERWRLRDAEAQTLPEKLERLCKKALFIPFANRPGLRILSWAEQTTTRLLRTSDEYLDLFRETRPSLVFNGSHVHSYLGLPVVQAAQWLGIPTATFIFSWDNLTSQGRIIRPYDYYLVWNEELRDQLLDIYDQVRPEQVFVTGTPQFDTHFHQQHYWSREEFCQRVGADPTRPIVLYSTGMDNHMPAEGVIIEGIVRMLREMPERPQLMVRLYPKDRNPDRFDETKRRAPEVLWPPIPWEQNYVTPMIEDIPLLLNMIRHCAVGINVASTVSLELCMFDKPVLNVAYDPPGVDISPRRYACFYDFDHYRPVVESGAVRVAYSENELRPLLRKALEDPGADRELRAKLVQKMFGNSLDGRVGERIGSLLVQLAARGKR